MRPGPGRSVCEMEMLELRGLHKTFNPGTVNEKIALNGVSLTMEAGDFPADGHPRPPEAPASGRAHRRP